MILFLGGGGVIFIFFFLALELLGSDVGFALEQITVQDSQSRYYFQNFM